jgi:uncharacterized RDD family membrane protein YckC
LSQEHRIVTPEAVPLELETGGLGSRVAAALLDGLLQGVALFWIITAAAVAGGGDTAAFIMILSAFVFVPVVYGAVFEGLWNGRTPGKRALHLRVVQLTGQPVEWRHAVVRNLFRLVDQVIGALFIVITPRSQRLGDFAAGTVVVREPKGAAPQPFALVPDPLRDALARRIDTSAVGPREYGMLRDFLRRRAELDHAGRLAVGRQLADLVRVRVPVSPGEAVPDEVLIEAAVVSVQMRGSSPAGGE